LAAVSLLATACQKGAASPPDGGTTDGGPAWLASAEVLVSGHDVTNHDCRTGVCRHNENTDMIVWQGAIRLVHRTAESQVLGPNSSLRISHSVDGGKSFALDAVLPAPMNDPVLGSRDLRDPCFYVVGDKLFIKALTRLPVTSARDSDVDTVPVVTTSSDGTTWSPLAPLVGPTGHGWSFWRVKEQDGVYYTAAYQDGDLSVVLYSSTDGLNWTPGATVWSMSADTPVETELTFMPSGKMLALVRTDGTNQELLGAQGRLRTQVCWASPPFSSFSCPQVFDGQRLDGPLSFFWGSRLFVVARRHLGTDGRKRTALFELGGNFDGGPLTINDLGDLPSAGDTSYAGVARIDDQHALLSWYSGDLVDDESWIFGILNLTDIWIGVVDFSRL
jgi:hypothetical protein